MRICHIGLIAIVAVFAVPACSATGALSDSLAEMALVDQYLSLVTGHARTLMPEDAANLRGPGEIDCAATLRRHTVCSALSGTLWTYVVCAHRTCRCLPQP